MSKGNGKIWLGITAGALVSAAAMVTPAGAVDTEWDTTVRGDWGLASNWNNGVPKNDNDRAFLNITDAFVDYTTDISGTLELISIDNRSSLVQWSYTNLKTNNLVVGDISPADPNDISKRSAYHLNNSASLVVNNTMVIGRTGTGMFDQWGGSVNVGSDGSSGELILGHESGSRAEYYLFNVDTTLTVKGNELIGEKGDGYFKLDGGTNTVSGALVLSAEDDSRGKYDLYRGSLQTEKTVVSSWGQEGVFNQIGGSHEIADNLEIGLELGSVGRYNMTGGTLTAHDLHVGENGTGMFFQDYQNVESDGCVNIAGELFLGRNSDNGVRANGYYQLSLGTLNVGWAERIGVEGDAEFDQIGGTNITSELIIADQSGSTGKYTMTGGILEAAPMDGGSIIVGKGGVGEFYLSDGDISADNMDVGVTGNGTFSQSTGTNTVYNNLVLSRETGSVGTYDLNSGTLTTGETHVSAFGTKGLFFQTGGLHITDSLVLGYNTGGSGEYRLHNSGNLNAGTERIGLEGSGIFLNFEGTNTVRGDLILGQEVGSSGSYTLTDDGVLEVKGDEYIGQAGFGKFDMGGFSDVTHTVDGGLYVGNASSGSGEFYQSAGTTTVKGGYEIWSNSDGSSKQYAGLVLGRNGGSGIYEQTSGTLDVVNATIVGADGNGEFSLGGYDDVHPATHTTGELYVGYNTIAVDSGATGTYNLEGYGVLTVSGFTVIGGKDYGPVGNGVFNQDGGKHTTGGLFLGDNYESAGTYNLSDGELHVGNFEWIGTAGEGNFNQSGGTHTTNEDVSIGENGTYRMTGGDFHAGNNIVNDGLFHMEIADGAGSLNAKTFINNSNGILEGTGTITANVQNYGIISAGNSPGVMNITGNLVLEDSSALLFELEGTTQGTGYDYLHITGLATLGGSLNVELYDLGGGNFYDPNIGDIFTILVADGGLGGTFFSNYLLPDLADGKNWSIAYNDYDVTLHVNAVPVPPAVFLLASGLASLFMIKRRKV